MSFQDFMNKIRHWDNLTARWLMRHFYFMFFQAVLLLVFLIWFVNLFRVIDTGYQIPRDDPIGRITVAQSINTTIIVFLLLLNSFWVLFMFSSLQRMSSLLKDISYYMSRLSRSTEKKPPQQPS